MKTHRRRNRVRRAPHAPAATGEQAAQAIARARSKLGAPYVLATAGPETFDCSGLTWWAAQPILGPLDYELRSSHHQFNAWGVPVPGDDLRAGDLLFFDSMGVTVFGNRASHVGLYLGDSEMIHAANEAAGVIISRPFEGWYGPRLIGARRIFDLLRATEEPGLSETPPRPRQQRSRAPRRRTLPLLAGPIITRNQWNGGPFPVDWSAAAGWAHEVNVAAREARIDARIIAAVAMMETQFTHERNGEVLTIWDAYPQDGPSVGMMQFKPRLYAHVRPDLDPLLPAENLRRGAAIIACLLEETGGDLDAAMRRWFPAPAPNGTTPDRYLATFRGLLKEMDYAG
ncbi:MAG: NlpC/P60 family protein [Thermomicrobiales bacterium]